ncbi:MULTISPECIES: pyridoxal 5'-phosphate synthase glutaminase subunit PdxT [unclassified Corynebacterium]|uniref:pyridoxal 5'-phosphate synthase glutaminase subunit PdxT n=1 Tax=unclassified Corynebacterium TaxID=2624378 RepID=UPI0029C9F198|nr:MULTISPECIES: pyridoxal 5'-phosphate synthase glutaminase subunit PdxT [unclassified Corynebacterium]WPF65618.1 pyridoxal 5'-phosphate synthase glutaminase subunit PdxT [Corynebacterium sp. 22KM0430]WPF68113.1 pyridoxal 5'-phosphate synthase glutaminase subunit PdxT [Corynebacterium sp. 21KM1197]
MVCVGVLALQGGVAEHAEMLTDLGAQVRLVRRPEDVTGVDAFVLPGGESGPIDRLAGIFRVREPLIQAIKQGAPVLGTCAGLILLSRWGLLDVKVERNAFGPQVSSVHTRVDWEGTALDVAFIRGPKITAVGPAATACAYYEGAIVGARQGNRLGCSFHPELTGDTTLHRRLLAAVR